MKKQINSSRGERVAAKVQTIVAQILRDKYPEIGITITGADAAGGLQFVRLYYQGGGKDAQKRLDEITRMVRFDLAAKMNQKYVPNIRFAYDDTLERAGRIDELLANINKEK